MSGRNCTIVSVRVGHGTERESATMRVAVWRVGRTLDVFSLRMESPMRPPDLNFTPSADGRRSAGAPRHSEVPAKAGTSPQNRAVLTKVGTDASGNADTRNEDFSVLRDVGILPEIIDPYYSTARNAFTAAASWRRHRNPVTFQRVLIRHT